MNEEVVLNADPAVMRYFAKPMTRAESDESIDRYNLQLTRDGFTMFATECRCTGELLGTIGMQVMSDAIPNLAPPVVEIGWRLATSAHGRGLATEGAGPSLTMAYEPSAFRNS